MVYVKKVKIKGKGYWYLFHTVRKGNKYLKKSKYIGRDLPENIEEIKEKFEKELKKEPKDSKLINSLSPIERKIIPFLKEKKLSKIVEKSKLKDIEVMRALQWLENKNIVNIKKEIKEILELDKNGEIYKEKGLPEKRFLKILDKDKSLDEIREKLNKDEVNVCLGILKKRGLIRLGKKIKRLKTEDKIIVLSENFLKKLPLDIAKLSDEDKFIYSELKKRKSILKEKLLKDRDIKLTKIGEALTKEKLRRNLIENLSSEMLKNSTWKGKNFRRYDIKINVPRIYTGKRHFVNQAIDYAKRIWLDMGFKEMKGPIIDSSFWVFDALFTAQDHPVREMQDTIFLNGNSNLPEKELVKRVKATHENGGTTGSKGWEYKWDEDEAKKLVLRTHTTNLSARTLSKLKKEDLPAKFFAVGRNFRNETVDWSHLFEFNQTEGIVIDPNANFRHLLGYLKEFFKKMGYEKVRFRPAFFSYTSPSCEIDVYHPIKKKWLELGGAGIFRPEVVKPLLGFECPVLAWGPGFDRIIMNYYKIKDIRELYKNDLKQLREIKMWLK